MGNIVVDPNVKLKAIERDALLANRDLGEGGIKPIAIHVAQRKPCAWTIGGRRS